MTLAEAVSPRCYIVGDYVYHRPGRLCNEDLPLDFKTSAVVLYLQHVTTVTDILACVQKMTGDLCSILFSKSLFVIRSLLVRSSCKFSVWHFRSVFDVYMECHNSLLFV